MSAIYDAFSAIEGAFHRSIRFSLSKKKQGDVMERFREALSTSIVPTLPQLDIDALAQEIRRVDGNHDLGAGALAEALMPFLKAQACKAVTAEMIRHADHFCPTELPASAQWEWKANNIRYAMVAQNWIETPKFLRRTQD